MWASCQSLPAAKKFVDGNLEVVGRGREPQWQDGGGEGSGWAGLRYQGRLLGLSPAESEIRFLGKGSSS